MRTCANGAAGSMAMQKIAGTRRAIAGGCPATREGGRDEEESDIVGAKGREMFSSD